jgi:hypothetical protein
VSSDQHNGWSEALRVELRPDIRVTVIEPGAITTELTDHITDPASKRANKTATAEMGIPAKDIADVIAFAVSRPQRVTLNEILVRPPRRPCDRRRDATVPALRRSTGMTVWRFGAQHTHGCVDRSDGPALRQGRSRRPYVRTLVRMS